MKQFKKATIETMLSEQAHSVVNALVQAGGVPVLVGGAVRDLVLGSTEQARDIDIEVFGIEQADLEGVLDECGTVNAVGKQFAVYKVGNIDISLPRLDSKQGSGHRGFTVQGDPNLTFKEASRRRDFTVNAMGIDLQKYTLLDPWGGQHDLAQRVLRAVDSKTFAEDPLRALRAMQIGARLNMTVESDTVELCRRMPIHELPVERIGEEWRRLLLSEQPSIGLRIAYNLDILQRLHPQLSDLHGVPQNPEYHPEGDVWIHTLMAVDLAAAAAKEQNLAMETHLTIVLATLCHDFGKATTTVSRNGRWVSHGHANKGIEPAAAFLQSIDTDKVTKTKVLNIVRDHMFFFQSDRASDKAIRKLAKRLKPATIEELVMVVTADRCGRDVECDGFQEGVELQERAQKLGVATTAPEPLIQGSDLRDQGYQEGPGIGRMLHRLYEQQLEGMFTTKEEGLALLDTKNKNKSDE